MCRAQTEVSHTVVGRRHHSSRKPAAVAVKPAAVAVKPVPKPSAPPPDWDSVPTTKTSVTGVWDGVPVSGKEAGVSETEIPTAPVVSRSPALPSAPPPNDAHLRD